MDDIPPAESAVLSAGRLIRHAAAVATGVPGPLAEQTLAELAPLERVEYFRRSAGLRNDQRDTLWLLRARLRGIQAAAEIDDQAGTGGVIRRYWQWVIQEAYPTTPRGGARPLLRLAGNLASAIARDPTRHSFVLASWRVFARLLALDAERTLAQLGDHLDSCTQADTEIPTPRALLLALDIAVLTGLPQPIVTAHQDAWQREHDVLLATHEAMNARARGGSMQDYASDPPAEVPLNFQPRTRTTSDGRTRLVLAAPELLILSDEIAGRVIVRLVESVRLGALPRDNLAFSAAFNAFEDRRHGRRGPDGARIRQHEVSFCDGAGGVEEPEQHEPDEASLAAAEQFVIAQDWLSGALESAMAGLAGSLLANGPAAVFPTRMYGPVRSAGLGTGHLQAAQNALQFLTSAAVLHPSTFTPRLPAEAEPRAEFSRHMRKTVRTRWNSSDVGRHEVMVGVGAVTYAAWQASTGVSPEHAPAICAETGRRLLTRVQNYAGVAAVAGLASTLRQLAPPGARRTPSWHATVQAGSEAISELAEALAGRPEIGEQPGLPAAARLLAELAERYAGAEDLAEPVRRLRQAAVRLTDRSDG